MSKYGSYDKLTLTATLDGLRDAPSEFYNYALERNGLKPIVVSTPQRVSQRVPAKTANTPHAPPTSSFLSQPLHNSSQKLPTCAIPVPTNARRQCTIINSLAGSGNTSRQPYRFTQGRHIGKTFNKVTKSYIKLCKSRNFWGSREMKAAFEDWQRRRLEARNTLLHSQPIAPSIMRPLAQSGQSIKPRDESAHDPTALRVVALSAQSRLFPQQEGERHLRGMNGATKKAQSTTQELLVRQTLQTAQAELSSRSKSSFGATHHMPSAKRMLQTSASDGQPIVHFSLAIQERLVPGFVRTGEIPPYPVMQLPAYDLAGGGRYVMSLCYFDPPLEPRQTPIRSIQSSTTFCSREPPTYISSDSESDSEMLENNSDCEPPTNISSDSESYSQIKEYISGSESDKDADMSPHHHRHKDTSINQDPFIPDVYYLDFGDHCGKPISQIYSKHFDYILRLKGEGVHRRRPELGEAIANYERENFPAPGDYVFTFGIHKGRRFEQVPARYVKYLKGKGAEKLLDKHPGLRDALEWFESRPSRSAIADVAEAVIPNPKKRVTRAKGRR